MNHLTSWLRFVLWSCAIIYVTPAAAQLTGYVYWNASTSPFTNSTVYGTQSIYKLDDTVFAIAHTYVDALPWGPGYCDNGYWVCTPPQGVETYARLLVQDPTGMYQGGESNTGSYVLTTSSIPGTWTAESTHEAGILWYYYTMTSEPILHETMTYRTYGSLFVDRPRPTLYSLSPSSGNRCESGTMELTGTNLISGTGITVSGGSGVAITPQQYPDPGDGMIVASFSVACDAAAGDRMVQVSNAYGTSPTELPFTVPPLPSLPSIVGINLWGGFTPARGTAGYIEVYGQYLGPDASVSVSPSGATAIVSYGGDPLTNPPYQQINVYVTVDPDAGAGDYYLSVTTASGSASYLIFSLP